MARICAFVFNPVVRDARVIKQANSLAASGHEVTIIGLADNNYPEPRVTLESGIEVFRVPRDVGISRKNGGVLKRVERIATTAIRKWHIHLFFLPFIIAYLLMAGVSAERGEKIDLIIDLVLFGAALAGVGYLFTNLSNLFHGLQASLSWLTCKVGDRSRDRLVGVFKSVAPRMFEHEVERRARARIDHMVEMARKLAPDIVHCHDVHTLPVGTAMKRMTGCRVVYDAHEIYEELAQANQVATARYRALHRKNIPSVDGFITINESIAAWYKEHYPKIPEPTIVMNATIATPDFPYDGRLHAAAGLKGDRKILLYQGGFARKRGLEALIRAAACIPEDWTLVLMGWGKIEPDLRQIADKVNAATAHWRDSPAVCMLPAVPQAELPYWSAGATIGVIPYENVGLNHWLCTPNKLWEYPNARVPVLVSPFPELTKMVEKYRYGWVLPVESEPKLLAEQLAALSDEEIARAKDACADFSNVENWSRYDKRLLALYRELLGQQLERDGTLIQIASRQDPAGAI